MMKPARDYVFLIAGVPNEGSTFAILFMDLGFLPTADNDALLVISLVINGTKTCINDPQYASLHSSYTNSYMPHRAKCSKDKTYCT
jgi:hypothetical protein